MKASDRDEAATDGKIAARMEGDGYSDGKPAGTHLLFVWQPTGYELVERDGEPPAPGSEVEIGDRTERVTKIGPSPLPGDRRRCAYLLG